MADSQEVAGRVVTDTEYAVLRLTTEDEVEPEQRVPLFYIDDVEYTVVKNPPATVGLRYLRILKEEGEGQAAFYLLNQMLGEEGYAALESYDALTTDQYNQILELAVKISTGSRETPKVRRQRGLNGQRRLPG